MSRGRNFVRLHRRTTQFIFLAPCKFPLGHRGGFGDEVLNTNHQPTVMKPRNIGNCHSFSGTMDMSLDLISNVRWRNI